MGGNYPSSILGRIYVGNGTGWRVSFAKRHMGIDTDQWYLQDDGTMQGVETSSAPAGGVGIAGRDLLWPDATAHRWKMNNNNAATHDIIVGAATADTLSNKILTGASSANSVTKVCFANSTATITGNSTAQNLYTCTLNANVLALNSCVKYTVWWQHTSGAAAGSYQWNFGTQAMTAFSDSGTSMSKSVLTVCNGGTANSQQLAEEAAIDGATLVAGSQALINTGAVNTTSNVTVSFTFNAPATDAVKPYQVTGELIQ